MHISSLLHNLNWTCWSCLWIIDDWLRSLFYNCTPIIHNLSSAIYFDQSQLFQIISDCHSNSSPHDSLWHTDWECKHWPVCTVCTVCTCDCTVHTQWYVEIEKYHNGQFIIWCVYLQHFATLKFWKIMIKSWNCKILNFTFKNFYRPFLKL